MKKRALKKDFYMEIKKSRNRFISILLIVAMGVAFYSGIQSAAPDMRLSGDVYFDAHKLMDVRVIGTLGITEDDLKALAEVEGVKKVEPGYMTDVLTGAGDIQRVLHMESIPQTMNVLSVKEGRLPEEADECFLDSQYAEREGHKVGDVIEVSEELEEDEEARLSVHRFTVAGIGSSPAYISLSRGSSTLGNGEVAGFVYVPEDAFDMEVYTQAFLRVDGAGKEIAFTEGYESAVTRVKETVEEMEGTRCKVRYHEIKDEADAKLADARQELEDGKKEAEEKLADARKELEEAESELTDGQAEVDDGRKDLADARAKIVTAKAELRTKENDLVVAQKKVDDGKEQLKTAKQELKDGEKKYKEEAAEAKPKIAQSEKDLEAARAKLEAGKTEYSNNLTLLGTLKEQFTQLELGFNAGILTPEQQIQYMTLKEQIPVMETALATAKTELDAAEAQIIAGEKELSKAKAKLEKAKKKIEKGKKRLAKEEKKLNDAQTQIDDGNKKLAEGWKKIKDSLAEIADGEAELDDAQKEIDDGWIDLEEGKVEYADAEKEAAEEIADGEQKIADAQKEVDDIKVPKWYVDDRTALEEYKGYGENADRMTNIGRVFPVLFFLVAALISLTTMTRMVEEERTQIGTLKALGYGKMDIASKYMKYALFATLGGSVLGVLVGEKILPFIIINAYKIMYKDMPGIEIPYNMNYAVLAMGAALICTMAATISACYRELAATPAVLMRPPAPKQGKRVLMERIPFIWKHLSFIWKSTIRNLFRYKKRFFMTIFGIGGCMALILVGYGLRDSIMDIAVLQYKEIQIYDGTLLLDEDASDEEVEKLNTHIAEDERVEAFSDAYMKKLVLSAGEEKREVYLVVPQEAEHFERFVTLRDRVSGEIYDLDDSGIFLSEKTAQLLGVSVGDKVMVETDEHGEREIPVARICENYMAHYAYVTPSVYKEIFEKEPHYNSVFYKANQEHREEATDIGEDALKYDAALSVSYTGTVRGQVDDMLGALDTVIVVLIVSAGMLAFIVLYNLNNININERKRELATIKVLGFYDNEVSAYVYRENILLTIIGAAVGSGLGIVLHRFVIKTVEVDAIMFGRNIYWPSFLYSILFTFAFSIIVNVIMHYKLKKIDMVESLKSVE